MDKPFGTISIKPIGGLCNRLRAIDSALGLAAKNGHKVNVYWERDLGLNAKWEDLFEPTDSFELIDITENRVLRIRHKTLFAGSRLLPFYQVFKSWHYDKVIWSGDFPALFDTTYDFSQWTEYNRIYIQSLSRFAYTQNPYSFAMPVAEVKRDIDNIASGFDKNTVGFHIRGTDHTKALTLSPPESFVKKGRQLLKANSALSIYLACDEEIIKDQFKDEFGGAVITRKIPLERGSLAGMKEAVKDLFLLSRCSKVYGAQGSSFSTTAAEIGGVFCEKIKAYE